MFPGLSVRLLVCFRETQAGRRCGSRRCELCSI